MQRFKKGKFGRLEESETGEFVRWVDAENNIDIIESLQKVIQKEEKAWNSSICSKNGEIRRLENKLAPLKDCYEKQVLVIKQYKIGVFISWTVTGIVLLLQILKFKGVI